jgi:hypothetical protein
VRMGQSSSILLQRRWRFKNNSLCGLPSIKEKRRGEVLSKLFQDRASRNRERALNQNFNSPPSSTPTSLQLKTYFPTTSSICTHHERNERNEWPSWSTYLMVRGSKRRRPCLLLQHGHKSDTMDQTRRADDTRRGNNIAYMSM